jgi:putative transposase
MIRARPSFIPGGTHFFTVALADRKLALLTERIAALGAAFRRCRSSHCFQTVAIVVLPEHLHCIWTLPDGDADYAIRWSLIKRAFTRRLQHEGPTAPRGKRCVWEPRFREHAIRDDSDLRRHVDCIHRDPVKHGHASRPADWPHSSFHRYARNKWLADGLAAGDVGMRMLDPA